MDFVEVEGKTYEEAIKKASLELGTDEKNLDIEVKEVNTKGILGPSWNEKSKNFSENKRNRFARRIRNKIPERYRRTDRSFI